MMNLNNQNQIASYKSGMIRLYLTANSNDDSFFQYKELSKLKKVLYFSYRLNDFELSKKFSIDIDEQTAQNIGETNLINDLKNIDCEELYDFNIFIEGIEYQYIESNFDEVLELLAAFSCQATRILLNIVNIPLESQESFLFKIDKVLPTSLPVNKIIKALRPDRDNEFKVYTRSTFLNHKAVVE